MIKALPELTISGRGGKQILNSRVLQSPLAGVTDHVFRKLVRRWAPEALIFTEMVSATKLSGEDIHNTEKELSEEQGPIGVQLYDHRPEILVEAAIRAEAYGAFLIDINMGCPAKKIVRKGAGSGLLQNPELAERIVNQVANAIQIPVTVKTRLSTYQQDSVDPLDFALRMQNSGAQLLTIHGRTRKQGFSGKADWFAIAKIKHGLNIPLIANGDIQNPTDALRCLEITGADGVMIGRGSMGAPWLIGQIDCALKGKSIFKAPSPKERITLILEQLQELLKKKGENGLFIARKHMSWTCKGFSGANNLRDSLIRAKTSLEAINLLEDQLLLMS